MMSRIKYFAIYVVLYILKKIGNGVRLLKILRDKCHGILCKDNKILFKYEILTKSDSAQVARLLEIQNFEDGVDYSCINTVIDDGRLYKYPLRFEGELITS